MSSSQLLEYLIHELAQMEETVKRGLDLIQPTLLLTSESPFPFEIYSYFNRISAFIGDTRQRLERVSSFLIQEQITLGDMEGSLVELQGSMMKTKQRVEWIVDRWESQP